MGIYENLSERTIKNICEYVNGDTESTIFKYRTGSQLVDFFRRKFHITDLVAGPSRWTLTARTIQLLDECNDVDSFFNHLFSIRNMNHEYPDEDDTVCATFVERGINDINKYLKVDDYELIKVNGELKIVEIDSSLQFLGEGGFSKVYRIAGTNLVKKKLKDDFKRSRGVVSRFKNEYDIVMTTLKGIPGIITAYDYDSMGISYTMEYCETDLYKYINNTSLDEESQYALIVELLEIMNNVHELDVIHRDLSPKNIFVKNRHLVIADFGLGKDLNKLRSHQTYDTAYQGTLEYCDPRQIRSLSEGDKKSDIYSLGKLINFIMTRSPHINNHMFAIPVTIATNENAESRFNDVKEFLDKIKKIKELQTNEVYIQNCLNRLKIGLYESDMDEYILSLSRMDLVYRMSDIKFKNVYKKLMYQEKYYPRLEQVLTETLEDMNSQFRVVFNGLDGFGYLMIDIVKDINNFNPNIKLLAAKNLEVIAINFNRYNVQNVLNNQYNNTSIGNEYLHDIMNFFNNK